MNIPVSSDELFPLLPDLTEQQKLLIINWAKNNGHSDNGNLLVELKEDIAETQRFLSEQINNRLLTIEWQTNKNSLEVANLVEKTNELFVESQIALVPKERLESKFELICNSEIAFESNDYLEPESTVEGLHTADWFVHETVKLFDAKKIRYLDIGCGGGALAFSFFKAGHFSLGLDGSDHCKKNSHGFWNKVNFLNTCDVSQPFSVNQHNEVVKFELITMWEVFEHIPETSIDAVLQNIRSNLSADGFFIGSISTLEYVNLQTGTEYHVTLQDKAWWSEKFKQNGLVMVDLPIPVTACYRGVGNRYQDPHSYITNPEAGFHFAATFEEAHD